MKCEILIAYHIADSVLQVALSANRKTFDELKKEDPVMCDALKELMRPEMEEELDKARKEDRYDIFSTMIKNGIPISELYKLFGKEQVDQALGVTL